MKVHSPGPMLAVVWSAGDHARDRVDLLAACLAQRMHLQDVSHGARRHAVKEPLGLEVTVTVTSGWLVFTMVTVARPSAARGRPRCRCFRWHRAGAPRWRPCQAAPGDSRR